MLLHHFSIYFFFLPLPQSGSDKKVVFLQAEGGTVAEHCPHTPSYTDRRPTDNDIVNRLDQKMMAMVKFSLGFYLRIKLTDIVKKEYIDMYVNIHMTIDFDTKLTIVT